MVKISESRLSGLYFFLAFLFIVVGFSAYKSFYAIVSPKHLQEVLKARLEKDVNLYELKLTQVDFHFFYGILFKPGLSWKGFQIAYDKNCNFVEARSPDVYFAVDLASLFRRRLEVEEVISNHLEVKIIRDYACENIEVENVAKREEAIRSPAQTIDRFRNFSSEQDLSFVKNLPDFRVANLYFYPERNLKRFFYLKNLSILKENKKHSFQSELLFSDALNIGALPALNVRGSFDRHNNILVSSRLREARLEFRVESLGEKNFKTSLYVNDLPFQYVINMLKDRYPYFESIENMSSQWMTLSAHTVSHWDDFFEKNLIIYVEDFKLTGDYIKVDAKPFQFKLKDRSLISPGQFNAENVNMELLRPYMVPASAHDFLLSAGKVKGNLTIEPNRKAHFTGTWHGANLYFDFYDYKKSFEVLPTKVNFESEDDGFFFSTQNLALRDIAGNMEFSLMKKDEKWSAKFAALNVVAGDLWKRWFNASIDSVNLRVDLLQDQILRWKGFANFVEFKGEQVDAKTGTLRFERNSLIDKLNLKMQNLHLAPDSLTASWVSDVYAGKIVPNRLSLLEIEKIKNMNAEKIEEIKFVGLEPSFFLDLKENVADQLHVERSRPKAAQTLVPKSRLKLF